MIKKEDRNKRRKVRHLRVRKKISGTKECPRLNVFRSAKNIYAQLIDDEAGVTMVSVSTLEPGFKSQGVKAGTVEGAKYVGNLIAERAKEKGFSTVVFDRGGYIYHGRIEAIAQGAREGGLKF